MLPSLIFFSSNLTRAYVANKGMSVFVKGAASEGAQLTIHEQSLLFASRGVIGHLAQPLVSQMGITRNVSRPLSVLDLACGTAIVTDLVQKRISPEVLAQSKFRAVDASEGMVSVANKRIELEGWVNVQTEVMDAKKTTFPDSSFTHVAAALALHLIPEPDVVVRESMRILEPGGIFGATTFAAVNGKQWFVHDLDSAFASLPISVPKLAPLAMQMHQDGDWTDAKWIKSHLKELGLEDVIAEENPGSYRFVSAEDWMMTFEGMMNWMMNSKWDEEMRKKMPAEEVKQRVMDHLREKYHGGGWDVSWTTIVMTGRVPRDG